MTDTQSKSGEAANQLTSQPEFFRANLTYPHIPFAQMLTESAARHPENVAVIFKDLNLTYRELDSLVNAFANALHDLGIRKGDRVCLYMTNRPEYIVSFYALARIGAVVSPMNPSYKEREVEYQLNNSEAIGIICQSELLPLVQQVRSIAPALQHVIAVGPDRNVPTDVLHFASLIHKYPATAPVPVGIDWEDLLALPYSSGTTGLPKGVMLCHRNLVCNYVQMAATMRYTSQDKAMLFLPFYHIYGIMLMGATMYSGATAILMERFEPTESFRLIREKGVTLLFVVPPILVAMANMNNLNPEDFASVRFVMTGAAPAAIEIIRKVSRAINCFISQGYGLSEASPLTHLNPVNGEAKDEPITVGLPVHDTLQKIVDIETGEQELGPNEVGELVVYGPQVMQGYWKAPEATAVTLRNGWLYTGDIGSLNERGYLTISDRKKEMIKYKGFGIAPAEIEALLFEHPAVADVAVVPKPDDEAGELPKAYVVKKADAIVTEAEILAFANGKLAGYKKVHEVEFIDAIPKNASGKLLRRVLKEREREKRG